MSDGSLRDQAVAELKKTTVGYHNSKWTDPPTGTHWKAALDLLAGIDVPTPPPPPPPNGSPTPPAPPTGHVTTIDNAATLALNIYGTTPTSYSDYVINGSGDSAILIGDPSHGNKLSRFKLNHAPDRSAVSWAKHAIYCKSRGNTISDFEATNGGTGSDGLSVRMGGNTFQRCALHGFVFPIAYFEHDDQAGVVTFEDVTGDGTLDTAIWGDDSNGCAQPYIKQAFIFRRVWLTCPGSLFLSFGKSVFSGAGDAFGGAYVHIENCKLNGKPITAANVRGIPSDKLTIS